MPNHFNPLNRYAGIAGRLPIPAAVALHFIVARKGQLERSSPVPWVALFADRCQSGFVALLDQSSLRR